MVHLKSTFGTQELQSWHWCTCSNVGARSELSIRAEKTQHPAQAVLAPESRGVTRAAWLSDLFESRGKAVHHDFLPLAMPLA